VEIHRIDPLTAPDSELLPVAALLGAAEGERRLTPPTPAEVTMRRLRTPDATSTRHVLVAGALEEPDGAGVVSVEDGPANAHVGDVNVVVRPTARRRGIGRTLVEHAASEVAATGRSLLITTSDSHAPCGAAFAPTVGFSPGLIMRINRLELAELDQDLLDRWLAHTAPDYELVPVDGPLPSDLLPAAIQVFEAMNDAPTDELDVEDEVVTEEQIRAREARHAASGGRALLLLARHRATGDGAGFTDVVWQPHVPGVLWQGGTATRREHRGHGLGRWMKAAMLRWALDALPGLEEVRTENAHTNPHMLAINDALGFRPWGEETIWQRRLGGAA
jgi:mycothiol synthase